MLFFASPQTLQRCKICIHIATCSCTSMCQHVTAHTHRYLGVWFYVTFHRHPSVILSAGFCFQGYLLWVYACGPYNNSKNHIYIEIYACIVNLCGNVIHIHASLSDFMSLYIVIPISSCHSGQAWMSMYFGFMPGVLAMVKQMYVHIHTCRFKSRLVVAYTYTVITSISQCHGTSSSHCHPVRWA